jgi:large subunit ribosomal protein L4
MPVKTVRWIEMVFGEGLSAEEASARLADEEPEESASESETVEDEEPEEGTSESAGADSEEA